MKKFLAIVLVLAMALSMVACGGSTEAEGTFADELGTAGVLRVAMANDYPPYEADDGNGGVVGFDADMAQLVADELGLELEIVPMQFDTIITAIAAGTVDLSISCFGYNEERAKSVLYTDTYLTATQALIVNIDETATTHEELVADGGIMVAGISTSGMDTLNSWLDAGMNFEIQSGEEMGIFVEALKVGTIKGIVIEKCVAENYVAESEGQLKIIEDDLDVQEIKAITNLNNTMLCEAVNDAFAKIMGDEEGYTALQLKWFEK